MYKHWKEICIIFKLFYVNIIIIKEAQHFEGMLLRGEGMENMHENHF